MKKALVSASLKRWGASCARNPFTSRNTVPILELASTCPIFLSQSTRAASRSQVPLAVTPFNPPSREKGLVLITAAIQTGDS